MDRKKAVLPFQLLKNTGNGNWTARVVHENIQPSIANRNIHSPMARPALTDEQRRLTRRNIRNAAAVLYASNGLADISVRAVAEKAGISVGTLYAHFSSLTELMQSLWKEPLTRLIEELEKNIKAKEDSLEKLQVLLEGYANFAHSHLGIYRGAFLYVRPELHEQPTKVNLAEDRFFGLFRRTVIAAQKQGLARDGDPDLLAQTLWSGIHGAIALPQNVDRLALAEPNETAPLMIEALINWIRKDQDL